MSTRKLVWVIGGSSGIGAATAERIGMAGGTETIYLSGRREVELIQVAQKCERASKTAQAVPLPLDVTDASAVQKAYQFVLSKSGVPDVVVYSSGISQRSLALDTQEEVERKIFEINYFGATRLARAVVPDMVRRKSGKFLIVSSVAGKIGTPLRSSYAASKHAMHGYFDCLRAEVHNLGVQISIVCPGYIQTKITMKSMTGDGTPYGKVDDALSNGVSVNACAASIVKALDNGQQEIIISKAREKMAVAISRFNPGLMRRLARQLTDID